MKQMVSESRSVQYLYSVTQSTPIAIQTGPWIRIYDDGSSETVGGPELIFFDEPK
jgi:hypothetical protein